MPQDIPAERRKTTPLQFIIPTTEIDFGFAVEPEEEDQKDTIKDLKRQLMEIQAAAMLVEQEKQKRILTLEDELEREKLMRAQQEEEAKRLQREQEMKRVTPEEEISRFTSPDDNREITVMEEVKQITPVK